MKRVLTAELGSCLGQEVTVMGWVLRMRILSKVTFYSSVTAAERYRRCLIGVAQSAAHQYQRGEN